jgi:plastocyanin
MLLHSIFETTIKIMKKFLFYFIIVLFLTPVLNARIITVQTGLNNTLSFSPAVITDAVVGDTVKWVWVSGSHTTTSITVPTGAAAWDAPLTSINQTFIYKITVAGAYAYKCTPHFAMGMVGSIVASPSAIQQISSVINGYDLSQNYPNPFNPVTNINFSIPKNSFVSLKIYDMKGSLVQEIINQNLSAGEYKYDFNATNLASGIYLYRIEVSDASGRASKYTETKQMVLIK